MIDNDVRKETMQVSVVSFLLSGGFIGSCLVVVLSLLILIVYGDGTIRLGNSIMRFCDIQLLLVFMFLFLFLIGIRRIVWNKPLFSNFFVLYHRIINALDCSLVKSRKVQCYFFGSSAFVGFVMMMALTWNTPFHHDDWGILDYAQDGYTYNNIVQVIPTAGGNEVFRPGERFIFITLFHAIKSLGFDPFVVLPYRAFKALVFSGVLLLSALLLFLLIKDWRIVFVASLLLATARPMLRSVIWFADFTIGGDFFVLASLLVFFLYERSYRTHCSRNASVLFQVVFVLLAIGASVVKETARMLPFVLILYLALIDRRKIKHYFFSLSVIILFNLNPSIWLGRGWIHYDQIVRFKFSGLAQAMETMFDKFGFFLVALAVWMVGLFVVRRFKKIPLEEIEKGLLLYGIWCCGLLTLYGLMPYLCERHFTSLMVALTPLIGFSVFELNKIQKAAFQNKTVQRVVSFMIAFIVLGVVAFGFNSDLKYAIKKGYPLKLREIIRLHFEQTMHDALIVYHDWNIDFPAASDNLRFHNHYIDAYWDKDIFERIKTYAKPVFFVVYPWDKTFGAITNKELYRIFSFANEEYKVYHYIPQSFRWSEVGTR